jgi:hypothetical protein
MPPVVLDPHRPGWMALAACRGQDVATFVPHMPTEKGTVPAAHDRAVRWCARCEVCAECLAHGLDTGSVGTWGGRWLGRSDRPEVGEHLVAVRVAS